MAAGPISERNQDATIYVGGLDEKVTESLLWELFVQVSLIRITGKTWAMYLLSPRLDLLSMSTCPRTVSRCSIRDTASWSS